MSRPYYTPDGRMCFSSEYDEIVPVPGAYVPGQYYPGQTTTTVIQGPGAVMRPPYVEPVPFGRPPAVIVEPVMPIMPIVEIDYGHHHHHRHHHGHHGHHHHHHGY